MTVTQHARPVSTARPSAVAWIDDASAIVARMGPEGGISTCEIDRDGEPELSFLAMVVRAVGDRERIVILGPGEMRLALERQYVAVYRRPERLVDVEPAGPTDRDSIVERLRTLAR